MSETDSNIAGAAAHPAAAAAAAAVGSSTSSAPAPAPAPLAPASSRPMSHYSTRGVTGFEKLNLLGEGTYGSVYRALDKATGEIVALKKIRLLKEKSGFPLTSVREVSLLQAVSHSNIIRLREMAVGRKPDHIFLVFDYCAHDLATLIDRMTRPFSESEVKRIMLQLLAAVDYLHRNFIIHRDLKLSNLLVDEKGRLKLADFGLARLFSNPLKEMTPKVVTLWYRSPELLLGTDKYHSAIDMWAIGCIFGELLHHRPMLPGKNESHQLSLICQLLGSPNEKIWPGFSELAAASLDAISLPSYPYNNLGHEFPKLSEMGLDLLTRLLTYDPSKRITAEKALNHPYFSQAPLPCPEHLMPTFAPMSSSTSTSAATSSTHHHHHLHNSYVISQPNEASAPASTVVVSKKRKPQQPAEEAIDLEADDAQNKRTKREE